MRLSLNAIVGTHGVLSGASPPELSSTGITYSDEAQKAIQFRIFLICPFLPEGHYDC